MKVGFLISKKILNLLNDQCVPCRKLARLLKLFNKLYRNLKNQQK